MPTKALTILIADEQHLQRLHIEKMLNQLGYYRIVPVQTFDEVLILTAIPAEPFDVLIIHSGLFASTGGALAFQKQHPQVRHVLVYDDQDLESPVSPAPLVLMRLPGSLDSVTLEHFMDIIDPPSPANGLRVLPWLRELARSPAV
ncbi:chemotaxis protein CheY [Pseudomonas sp. TAE6080]|uniref:chemotaxis protein CheY n=1 Tax=Pseudomonas sp. TAE6080 TaxID=2840374 RepID=UPI001BFFF4A2|nr:chemotaxis protein CheY [Pseudomonas sp. TAE6080]MBT9303839.1 chemotaxis protein CheY [Pseudomonas sp. TAE6080]